MSKASLEGRVPVSTIRTGCMPFNKKQKACKGYKVGETPVKTNGVYTESFEDALDMLRGMKHPGWRNFGRGNNGSAHQSIGWITQASADLLLSEPDDTRRIQMFLHLDDIVK